MNSALERKKAGGRLAARRPNRAHAAGSLPVVPVSMMPAMMPTPAGTPAISVVAMTRIPSPSVPAVPPAGRLIDRIDGVERAADAFRAAYGHGARGTGHHRSAGEHGRRGSQGENTLSHVSLLRLIAVRCQLCRG